MSFNSILLSENSNKMKTVNFGNDYKIEEVEDYKFDHRLTEVFNTVKKNENKVNLLSILLFIAFSIICYLGFNDKYRDKEVQTPVKNQFNKKDFNDCVAFKKYEFDSYTNKYRAIFENVGLFKSYGEGIIEMENCKIKKIAKQGWNSVVRLEKPLREGVHEIFVRINKLNDYNRQGLVIGFVNENDTYYDLNDLSNNPIAIDMNNYSFNLENKTSGIYKINEGYIIRYRVDFNKGRIKIYHHNYEIPDDNNLFPGNYEIPLTYKGKKPKYQYIYDTNGKLIAYSDIDSNGYFIAEYSIKKEGFIFAIFSFYVENEIEIISVYEH